MLANLGREHTRLGTSEFARLEKRATIGCGEHLDLLDGCGPDTAARRVDHTLNAHLVGRIHHHLEIGHHIAHLGTIKEPRAAHNLVGHACAQEHIFQDTRLRVRAIEHGDVVVRSAAVMKLVDFRGNPAPLIALVACLIGLNLLAIACGGEQTLVLTLRVMAHHGICRRKDMAGRAVILLELNHLGIGKILLEVEDVGDIGAAPGINRLVVVAHNHQVLVLGSEQVRNLVLHVIRILILVYADIAKTLLIFFEHLGAAAQKLKRPHEQVVKVHRVRGTQATLQLRVNTRGLLFLRTRRAGAHLVRADHGVFRRRDLGANHVDGVLLLLDGKRLHDIAHHAARIVIIVDGELAGIAQKISILAKHAHAHSVERAYPHATRALRQKRA